MSHSPDFRRMAYLVVVLGAGLAAVTAVVPHYTAGHKLLFGVLLAGLLPYLIYGMLVQMESGWPALVAGAALLAIDLAVKLPERLRYDGYADGAVYYAPLIATFAVLPLVFGVGRALRRGKGKEK
jgi:hypothetical protein